MYGCHGEALCWAPESESPLSGLKSVTITMFDLAGESVNTGYWEVFINLCG